MPWVVKEEASRTWVLQAYLGVNPSRPAWSGIEFTSVTGWEKYQRWDAGGSKFWRDPRLVYRSRGWSFVSREAAEEVLAELLALEQRYYLRVVERQYVMTECHIGGYWIDDGAVVPKPDGSKPVFMGEEVEGCVVERPRITAPLFKEKPDA